MFCQNGPPKGQVVPHLDSLTKEALCRAGPWPRTHHRAVLAHGHVRQLMDSRACWAALSQPHTRGGRDRRWNSPEFSKRWCSPPEQRRTSRKSASGLYRCSAGAITFPWRASRLSQQILYQNNYVTNTWSKNNPLQGGWCQARSCFQAVPSPAFSHHGVCRGPCGRASSRRRDPVSRRGA